MEQKLYLMKNGLGLYKIGISKNPSKRAKDIANNSGVPVELVSEWKTKRVAKYVERNIHIQMKRHRKIGEWFDCDEINLLSVCSKEANNENCGTTNTIKITDHEISAQHAVRYIMLGLIIAQDTPDLRGLSLNQWLKIMHKITFPRNVNRVFVDFYNKKSTDFNKSITEDINVILNNPYINEVEKCHYKGTYSNFRKYVPLDAIEPLELRKFYTDNPWGDNKLIQIKLNNSYKFELTEEFFRFCHFAIKKGVNNITIDDWLWSNTTYCYGTSLIEMAKRFDKLLGTNFLEQLKNNHNGIQQRLSLSKDLTERYFI